jgi:hypothetical protein
LNMLAQFYKTNLHWVKEKYSLKAVLIWRNKKTDADGT